MNRFLVFQCRHHYPSGGWKDFENDFAQLEEAVDWAEDNCNRRSDIHIVDLESGRIIGRVFRKDWRQKPDLT